MKRVSKKVDYSILIKKDRNVYVGYCLEIPQARGQGDTRSEAITDTKKAIKLCKSYIEDKKKNFASELITIAL